MAEMAKLNGKTESDRELEQELVELEQELVEQCW